ncbi:MAG: TetR/AcrR family transcriptional regulator [Solirubrobacteraceae bacterium]
MTEPAYTRLAVDERRRRLLELGAELFTQHAYNDLSMAQIARRADISKALLYHYFPSKHAYFLATLSQAADELRTRTEPDPALPPVEQLRGSLDAFLAFIDERGPAYRKLMETAYSVPEVRELVEGIRRFTADRILEALVGGGEFPPTARAAVRAWLWFTDGAILDWLEYRDFDRAALSQLLLDTLLGSLAAATGEPVGEVPRLG